MSLEVEKIFATVSGFIEKEEGELLYNLAIECPKDTVIAEIGSYFGQSTLCLAYGSKTSKKGCKVIAIDPFRGQQGQNIQPHQYDGYERFLNNITDHGMLSIVEPIVNTSEYAAIYIIKRLIGLLFVDGNHDYECEVNDLNLWLPKVAEGGVIAVHDTLPGSYETSPPFKYWPGAIKAYKECILSKPDQYEHLGMVSSISYARKK